MSRPIFSMFIVGKGRAIMPMPTSFIPAPPRRVGQPKRRTATTAIAEPTLIAAAYDEGNSVTLTFDRAIDVGGVVGAAIRVSDGGGEVDGTLAATGAAVVLGPGVVRLGLVLVGPPTGPGSTLTASANNGIVADDGGAMWAGVTGLELPFAGQ